MTWASAVLLAVGLLALIVIVAMTVGLVRATREDFAAATLARDLARSAVQLRHGLQSAESSQRGYINAGNEIYLAPYGTAKDTALRELPAMIALMEPAQRDSPATARLIELVNAKFAELDATIELKRKGDDAGLSEILNQNSGKALMDEANVFLSSIIRSADSRFFDHIQQQRQGLVRLQQTITVSALVILLVVGASIGTIGAFARNLGRARDLIESANASLERRVETRTAELRAERDRAELLLSEVNHRVANSLALVASMVRLQARAAKNQAAKDVLTETEARISAVAMVHKKLYASGDVRDVDLREFITSMVSQLEIAMQDQGHTSELKVDVEPIRMTTDRTVNLGVIVAEWVTNAVKYAYPEGKGEVRISLRHQNDGRIQLRVEDDGIGHDREAAPKGTGLGSRLVSAMASALGGEIAYQPGNPGTDATLTLPVGYEEAA